MSAIRRRAACVLLVAAISSTTTAASDLITIEPAQIAALGIATAPPQPGGQRTLSRLPAKVVIPSRQQYVVSAPFSGMVERVTVDVSDEVRRGQALVRIQSPEIAVAQRSYVEASAQTKLAEQSLSRDESLLREGIIARSRYEGTRAQHATLASTLAERRAALVLSGIPVPSTERGIGDGIGGRATLTAPADGVVLERSAVVGQRVEASAALLRIARLDLLWLEIQVPAVRARALEQGLAVDVADTRARGRIIALGKVVDPSSQTVVVRAVVDEGAARLRPGEIVSATITVPAAKNGQWTVPTTAIARDKDRTLLFVRTNTGFRALVITVIDEGETTATVAAPLAADTLIATRGVAALKGSLLGIGSE